MEPDTNRLWTPAEIRASVGKILVESLGVDEASVTDDASLVRDLGAESIDFLDISFKCQQAFGVDVPARLIQARLLEWRGFEILARVLQERYRAPVTAEELKTVAPATIPAMLEHLEIRHGLTGLAGDDRGLAQALAERLLGQLGGMGLEFQDLSAERLVPPLLESLHSPVIVDEVLNRFTVRALVEYLAGHLRAASRLATGT
jgi:acyl carrier protein